MHVLFIYVLLHHPCPIALIPVLHIPVVLTLPLSPCPHLDVPVAHGLGVGQEERKVKALGRGDGERLDLREGGEKV